MSTLVKTTRNLIFVWQFDAEGGAAAQVNFAVTFHYHHALARFKSVNPNCIPEEPCRFFSGI